MILGLFLLLGLNPSFPAAACTAAATFYTGVMIPPNQSLVRYENPTLISRTTDKKSTRARPKKPKALPDITAGLDMSGPVPLGTVGGASSSKKKLPPVESKAQKETEDILNSILPPREYEEKGQLWVQQVASSPATRGDVVTLQAHLDTKLQQRQARETGICPVRRELYAQAFDEIIRQVTVNCAERGLLLLRVRDELRMTLAAYQTLYESSVAFGMRKALQAEQGKVDNEAKIAELEQSKADLVAEVSALKAKCEEIERRESERRATEQMKYEEQISQLKTKNAQYKTQLDSILAPTKK